MPDLPSRVVVTLGATGPIGSAVARRLAGPETALVLGYLDGADRAEALGRDLTACSHSVHFVTGNLSEPATIAHLRDLVDALGGRCHALVHAVAVANFRPLSEIRGNQWKLVHEVSAWSFVGAVIGVTDALVRAGGAVVALSSHGSTRFVPGYGALGPAKAALESSVRQLACELAGRGVRINAVRAGMTESPNADRFPPEVRDAAVRRTPLGRLGKPEEIAAAVDYLLSPDASWITGQVLDVDGGFSVA